MSAKVVCPLSDLGPVEYDATSNAIMFDLNDTGLVADALSKASDELSRSWGMLPQDQIGEHR